MIEDYADEYLKKILSETKTIAIVGASPNNERDSYKVMKTLLANEYVVFPVNPNEAGNKILGQICYSNLQAINQSVDMVDVFRASHALVGIAKEAIQIGAKTLWTQLDVINDEAASIAKEAGLKVVMNRCPKIELAKPYWTSKTK